MGVVGGGVCGLGRLGGCGLSDLCECERFCETLTLVTAKLCPVSKPMSVVPSSSCLLLLPLSPVKKFQTLALQETFEDPLK